VDASPEMIATTRSCFPELDFHVEDTADLRFHAEFDAVFSHAALHWMEVAEAI
jgi:trans-aconitate methyltransferase